MRPVLEGSYQLKPVVCQNVDWLSVQFYRQGDQVHFLASLFGATKCPFPAPGLSGQQAINGLNHSRHIDHRVSRKDLGQALGQVADQAAAGSFVQAQLQIDALSIGAVIGKFNVIGPLAGIAEQGIKKIIGTFSGKKLLQGLRGKEGVNGLGVHDVFLLLRVDRELPEPLSPAPWASFIEELLIINGLASLSTDVAAKAPLW
jgi:hypothetical protein